ncbi:MAG: type I restriction endonuclease subunit R, partial [Fibrella sp.]|nr:type I restriction endonuclease subunit R [Armatimonadota bacterium]
MITPTNTSEKGLEDLIVAHLTGQTAPTPGSLTHIGELAADYAGAGYLAGTTDDYDKEHALDARHFRAFLEATQPALFAALDWDNPNPNKAQFCARVRDEIGKRGIVDVLRHGVKFNQFHVTL